MEWFHLTSITIDTRPRVTREEKLVAVLIRAYSGDSRTPEQYADWIIQRLWPDLDDLLNAG